MTQNRQEAEVYAKRQDELWETAVQNQDNYQKARAELQRSSEFVQTLHSDLEDLKQSSRVRHQKLGEEIAVQASISADSRQFSGKQFQELAESVASQGMDLGDFRQISEQHVQELGDQLSTLRSVQEQRELENIETLDSVSDFRQRADEMDVSLADVVSHISQCREDIYSINTMATNTSERSVANQEDIAHVNQLVVKVMGRMEELRTQVRSSTASSSSSSMLPDQQDGELQMGMSRFGKVLEEVPQVMRWETTPKG